MGFKRRAVLGMSGGEGVVKSSRNYAWITPHQESSLDPISIENLPHLSVF